MCLKEVTTQGRSLLSLKAFKQGQHLLKINTHIHTIYRRRIYSDGIARSSGLLGVP